MTAAAGRPDPESATRAEIELAMLTHLREAYAASVAYGERDAEIYGGCCRRARTAKEARLNARIIAQRDPALADHARLLDHHQTMHALYAMHLLVTDRPVPPAGGRPSRPDQPGGGERRG